MLLQNDLSKRPGFVTISSRGQLTSVLFCLF